MNNEDLCNTHPLFDVEGDISLILQEDVNLSGVIAIYGAGGYHDTMVGVHATPAGYQIKGSFR